MKVSVVNTKRAVAGALLALAVPTLGACSLIPGHSSNPEEAKVKQGFLKFAHGAANYDGDAICDSLAYQGKPMSANPDLAEACPAAMEESMKSSVKGKDREQLKDMDEGDVNVENLKSDSAKVKASGLTGVMDSTEISMIKIDGKWLVDGDKLAG